MGDLWNTIMGQVEGGPVAVIGLLAAGLYRLLSRGDRLRDDVTSELRQQRDGYEREAAIAKAKVRLYEAAHGPLAMDLVVAEVDRERAWQTAWPRTPPNRPPTR